MTGQQGPAQAGPPGTELERAIPRIPEQRPAPEPAPSDLGNEFAVSLLALPVGPLRPAERLREATLAGATEGVRTFDLGGEATTSEVVDDVIARLRTSR